MNRSNRKYLLLVLFAVLMTAVGIEHGIWTAISVGIFFGKVYVLSSWLDRKLWSLLILYIALFLALSAMTHVYVALLGLGFVLIPWAVIKGINRLKRG